jgi:hypothetical protein
MVFLDHYRATRRTLAGETADPPGLDALLRGLLIERDLQDLVREQRERPWMAIIPLGALNTLLSEA